MSKFKPVSIRPIIPEKTFRAFVQTVLPTIYDDSLSYYELLNKAVKILNGNIENINILSENQSKFIEEVTNYINSLEISIVPYDIALNFDVDTFDEMKATIANGGICCIALLDTDGSKNYLYYSNDRYYSDSNQNRMTFNGLTNIKNADDYSTNNAPSIITLSLEKVNDAIVVSYNKKYKVATENDIDTAFANAIAISVQTYVFSYNVDSDTLSVSDVTRDIVGAINNNRICVCKVVKENKPDVECYYSGRNSVNNAEKLVFVGNIIDNGVCVGTKTVNIDADADAFLVEGVTSVNDKYFAENNVDFVDFHVVVGENNQFELTSATLTPREAHDAYFHSVVNNTEDNKIFSGRLIESFVDLPLDIEIIKCARIDLEFTPDRHGYIIFRFYLDIFATSYNYLSITGREDTNEWAVEYTYDESERILPRVTSADNGKFLRVVNGAWTAETVQAYQGGSY